MSKSFEMALSRAISKVADARGFELIFWLDSIGTGNGGSVFKAKMSGHAVAVKIQQNCTTNKMTILHRELQALAAIGSHVNVLQFIGASKLQHNVRKLEIILDSFTNIREFVQDMWCRSRPCRCADHNRAL